MLDAAFGAEGRGEALRADFFAAFLATFFAGFFLPAAFFFAPFFLGEAFFAAFFFALASIAACTSSTALDLSGALSSCELWPFEPPARVSGARAGGGHDFASRHSFSIGWCRASFDDRQRKRE